MLSIAIKRRRVRHFFWMLASCRFKQGCCLVDGDAIVVAFLVGGGVLIMLISFCIQHTTYYNQPLRVRNQPWIGEEYCIEESNTQPYTFANLLTVLAR